MRDEKKSESLEVRLPYSQKIAFMEACKKEGITASEALRDGIREFLASRDGQSQRSSVLKDVVTLMKMNTRKTVGSLIALSLGSAVFVTLPSQAQDKLFAEYDKNEDGYLTAGEISKNDDRIFAVLDTDGDGRISPDEFKREAEYSEVSDSIEEDEDGNPVRMISLEQTRIELVDAEKGSVHVSRWEETIGMDASQADVDALVADMKQRIDTMEVPGAPGMPELAEIDEMRAMLESRRGELELVKKLEQDEMRSVLQSRRDEIERIKEFELDELRDTIDREMALLDKEVIVLRQEKELEGGETVVIERRIVREIGDAPPPPAAPDAPEPPPVPAPEN